MMSKASIPRLTFALLIGLPSSGPGLARVPLTIAPTGHVTVPVAGDFGVRQFVFDTGAEGTAVYADFAESARLTAAGRESVQGQTGATDLPLVELRNVTLDGVRKERITASKLAARADGVLLSGIVGLDLFGDQIMEFDLPGKSLALLPAGSRPRKLQSQPLRASTTTGGLLTVPVRIGAVTAIAVIDTGARKTRFNWSLGKRLGWNPAELAEGDTIQGATNNAIATRNAIIPSVDLGSRHLTNMPVLVADLPVFEAFGVADTPAVILGLDWLASTRMVIDFPAKLVWFEPSTAVNARRSVRPQR
jgi:hypothetical protein